MNSLAHSILKLSMRWTPSLTHPSESTFGELKCSRSACSPYITNYSLATPAKHIPDPKDLVLQVQTPQTHAYNFLSLGDTKEPSQTVHISMNSRHSRLSHGSSPKLVQLSRLSWITSPKRAWNSGLTPSSRLGELFSPERDLGSLKHTQLLAWTWIRAQHAHVSSWPRLGKSFSPERVNVPLNPKLGRLCEKLEPKPWTSFCNSHLGEGTRFGENCRVSSLFTHTIHQSHAKIQFNHSHSIYFNNQTIWSCFMSI